LGIDIKIAYYKEAGVFYYKRLSSISHPKILIQIESVSPQVCQTYPVFEVEDIFTFWMAIWLMGFCIQVYKWYWKAPTKKCDNRIDNTVRNKMIVDGWCIKGHYLFDFSRKTKKGDRDGHGKTNIRAP